MATSSSWTISMGLAVSASMLAMVLLAAPGGAFTCGDIMKRVDPCIAYLEYGGEVPHRFCCIMLNAFSGANTATKQKLCSCIVQALDGMDYYIDNARTISSKCGPVPFQIYPGLDCSKIT